MFSESGWKTLHPHRTTAHFFSDQVDFSSLHKASQWSTRRFRNLVKDNAIFLTKHFHCGIAAAEEIHKINITTGQLVMSIMDGTVIPPCYAGKKAEVKR